MKLSQKNTLKYDDHHLSSITCSNYQNPKGRVLLGLMDIIIGCLFMNIAMWDERGLFQHSQRKKETKQIINKIDARHYQEMRSNRSEGSEVAIDYAIQLRHAVRKSKTEKLTLHKNLRQKLITQLRKPSKQQLTPIYRPSIVQFQQITFPDRVQSNNKSEQLIESERCKRQLVDEDEKQSGVLGDVSNSSSSQFQQEQQLQSAKSADQALYPQQLLTELQQNKLISVGKQQKHFLPMLQLYIQDLAALKQMSPHEKRVRNLIVTMMVLAINRRQNTRLLDALDILLQTQIYFPRQNKQMLHLKSVWLSLIGKIYQEITKHLKDNKGSSRWRRSTRKTSIGSKKQLKLQNTIFIRSLASRKTFLDKFSESLRRSRLIYESTYAIQLKNELNVSKVENGRRVISRISPDLQVSFPEPSQLFHESQAIINYAMVIVSKDKQANLFPLNYPQSLRGCIYKQDYIAKLVKINSFLVPTARCMNLNSALFLNFQLILAILVILLISSILLLNSLSALGIITTIFVTVLVFFIVGMRMHAKNHKNINHMSYTGQLAQIIQKFCRQWSQQYRQQQIKFSLDDNADIFIISFPIDEEEVEQLSSFAFERHSRQSTYPKMENELTRKCSIKLNLQSFENPLDQACEESSQDNELNKQFWKKLQVKHQDNAKQWLGGGIEEQSSDEVVQSPKTFNKDVQVELVMADDAFGLEE